MKIRPVGAELFPRTTPIRGVGQLAVTLVRCYSGEGAGYDVPDRDTV